MSTTTQEPLVLIVEDDPEVSSVLQVVVENANYKTLIASTGVQAIALLKQQKPAAMTLDINMPEMSGLEVLDQLHGTPYLDGVKIILASGQPEDELIEGVVNGADWVLQKPIDLNEVVEVLDDLLRRQ